MELEEREKGRVGEEMPDEEHGNVRQTAKLIEGD